MSIAYLDPGNIESDLQSGAKAEFKVNPPMITDGLSGAPQGILRPPICSHLV